MMTSGRAAFASSGVISGTGFAIAKMSGSFAIVLIMSPSTSFAAETPMKASAPYERLGDRALLRVAREALLVRVHVLLAALVDHAGPVDHEDVLELHAVRDVEVRARDGRGARAREDDLHVLDLLSGELERVQERGRGDDRGPVLVVVEDGDLHPRLELLLDVEALGRLDVLEVDAAERRLEAGDAFDELVGVLLVDFDVERVDVRELLEEDALAFHDGLGAQRADVAEAEHGGSVGHDGDAVSLPGVFVDELGIARDLQAGLGHAGRVGKGEILGRAGRLAGNDLQLPLATRGVVVEGFLFGVAHA